MREVGPLKIAHFMGDHRRKALHEEKLDMLGERENLLRLQERALALAGTILPCAFGAHQLGEENSGRPLLGGPERATSAYAEQDARISCGDPLC
jgi:hypothetical protein